MFIGHIIGLGKIQPVSNEEEDMNLFDNVQFTIGANQSTDPQGIFQIDAVLTKEDVPITENAVLFFGLHHVVDDVWYPINAFFADLGDAGSFIGVTYLEPIIGESTYTDKYGSTRYYAIYCPAGTASFILSANFEFMGNDDNILSILAILPSGQVIESSTVTVTGNSVPPP